MLNTMCYIIFERECVLRAILPFTEGTKDEVARVMADAVRNGLRISSMEYRDAIEKIASGEWVFINECEAAT